MEKQKFLLNNLQLFAEPGAGEGADGGGNEPGAQVQQPQIDYEKMAEAIDKRTSQTTDNLLKGYLKQQGLTGEELNKAVNSFKQQKAQEETQKAQEHEQDKLRIKELEAQILNSNIDTTLSTLAAAEGISPDKVPFLAKLIDRDG